MTTTINVTGQISGNIKLFNALGIVGEIKASSLPFYGYSRTYKTKRAAKTALWEAFKYLRSQEPEFAKQGISYSKYGSLNYDASRAEIISNG